MWTTQNPTHCPKCMSKDIILGSRAYKKDVYGDDTDIVSLVMNAEMLLAGR